MLNAREAQELHELIGAAIDAGDLSGLARARELAAVLVSDTVTEPLTCYVCDAPIADGVRQCPHCGNHVRCEVDGCDADMSSMKCPNDKASCLDDCGEDHTL